MAAVEYIEPHAALLFVFNALNVSRAFWGGA
jgi:hypothetical protein